MLPGGLLLLQYDIDIVAAVLLLYEKVHTTLRLNVNFFRQTMYVVARSVACFPLIISPKTYGCHPGCPDLIQLVSCLANIEATGRLRNDSLAAAAVVAVTARQQLSGVTLATAAVEEQGQDREQRQADYNSATTAIGEWVCRWGQLY